MGAVLHVVNNLGFYRLRFGAFLLAAIATASPGQTVGNQPTNGPPVPYVDIGACPFEGCVYREWGVEAAVKVFAERRATAAVAFTLKKGDRVQAIDGMVITVRAGRVQFKKAIELRTEGGKVHVEPADTLFLLTYRGEGQTVAWFKGKLYKELDGAEFFNGACGIPGHDCNGKILAHPTTEWWIHVRNARGVEGWTNQPDRFCDKDAVGVGCNR